MWNLTTEKYDENVKSLKKPVLKTNEFPQTSFFFLFSLYWDYCEIFLIYHVFHFQSIQYNQFEFFNQINISFYLLYKKKSENII